MKDSLIVTVGDVDKIVIHLAAVKVSKTLPDFILKFVVLVA